MRATWANQCSQTTVVPTGDIRSATRRGGKWCVRHFVYVITHGKFIQAVMTGSAVAIISTGTETVGLGLNAILGRAVGMTIPLPPLVFLVMSATFAGAFWADHHTEEWRAYVEETTGEEAADESTDADG